MKFNIHSTLSLRVLMNSTHAKKFVELVRGKASCKIVIVMQIHFYTVLYVFATEKK